MLPDDARVVIVGASLAGMRTAEGLRAAGYGGSLTLVGEEQHLPYDRPPLSKQFLTGERTADELIFPTAPALADLGIDMVLGRRATGYAGDRVHVDDDELPCTHLVVATGGRARELEGLPPGPRVHRLRTLEDAQRLRAALDAASSLLVVGGGFVGSEVAAVARKRGLDVTLLARGSHLLPRLGAQLGAWCSDLHRDRGVGLALGPAPVSMAVTDDEVRVRSGAEVHTAEHVVVGVGARPNVEWLAGAGLDLREGVRCDGHGRALGANHVYAVGDVAAWWSPTRRAHTRVEHWTSAVEQAHAVVHTMLGTTPPRAKHGVPYFWSDQHDIKLQVVGWTDRADSTRLVELTHPRAVALYTARDRLVAAATVSAPALLARLKPLVAAGAAVEEAEALLSRTPPAPRPSRPSLEGVVHG